ncbi:MAG: glycine cleavage T C-terminal barrel domain-containing protein [Pirellulales bacterium]
MDAGPLSPELVADYQRAVEAVGWLERPRLHVELAGADRAKFLHNFCTADIRKLAIGRGCEAFVTSGQGKTLDFVTVFAGPDSLTVSGEPGGGPKLVAHLDRYLIREQVTLHERSDEWGEILLVGPQAEALLAGLGIADLPVGPWGEAVAEVAEQRVRLRRIDELNAPAWTLVTENAGLPAVRHALNAAGAAQIDPVVAEILRVEAGFPRFGRDVSDKNLPQEVHRDEHAISFTKGCYLGQETVARIDALGHVNRTLCRLAFSGPAVPPAGMPFEQAGQAVGEITSAVWSPRLGAIGLGYVRRGHSEPGATFTTPVGMAMLRPAI